MATKPEHPDNPPAEDDDAPKGPPAHTEDGGSGPPPIPPGKP